MDWIKEHWAIIAFLANGGLAWFLWSMAQKFATRGDIEKMKKDVGDQVAGVSNQVATVRSRVDIVESEMRHLPTAAGMHETNIQLTKIVGAMEAIARDYHHVLGRQTRLEDAMIRHEHIMSDAARLTATARKTFDEARRRDHDERS